MTEKLSDDIMGYLICDTCNDVYKLQDEESPGFDTCQCGGNLEYYKTLHDFVDQFYNLSNFGDHEWKLLLKKGYKRLEKKNRDLKEEHSKLKDANLELEGEILELKEFHEKLKDINTEVEEENLELKDRITSVKDRFLKLESENSSLTVNYSELQEQLSKLKDSRLEIKDSKAIDLSKKDSGHSKNSKLKYNYVNSYDSNLGKKLKESMADNEKLEKELSHTSLKLGNLRQYNRGLETKNSELKQDILRLKEVEHDYKDLNQKYMDLEKYNEKLLTKDSTLSKNYNKLKNNFSKLEKENFKLKESANYGLELENKYQKLQDRFLKLEEENSTLNSEVSELKDNFSNIREKNLELKSFKDENEDYIQELKDNYEELLEKYSKSQIKSSDLTELRKLNEKLLKDNYRLKTDFNQLKTRFSDLKDENLKLMETDGEELKTRYNELNTNYYRLKVEHNNLKQRYVALKNKNKSKALKVDFSSEDDTSLKTHIVCEDCGQKLPLSQFYRTKTNERGYTMKCKSCTRKRKAIQGLVELSRYIELDTPFSKEELKNVIKDQPFSIFENYMWVLLELDILSYLEDEDKYVLKADDNLKGFCGTYGISLEL